MDRPPLRCLCIVDDGTRESLALLADFSTGGARVARLLDELACRLGLPAEIVMDNGPGVHGPRAVRLVGADRVRLRFIQPGKPIQNAFVESFLFIGRFRDECLNQHWFGSLAEARRIIEAWRQHYNRERPHSALGYEPPERFTRRLGALGIDEGPHPSPALAPAPDPCYDANDSPSPRTYPRGKASVASASQVRDGRLASLWRGGAHDRIHMK